MFDEHNYPRFRTSPENTPPGVVRREKYHQDFMNNPEKSDEEKEEEEARYARDKNRHILNQDEIIPPTPLFKRDQVKPLRKNFNSDKAYDFAMNKWIRWADNAVKGLEVQDTKRYEDYIKRTFGSKYLKFWKANRTSEGRFIMNRKLFKLRLRELEVLRGHGTIGHKDGEDKDQATPDHLKKLYGNEQGALDAKIKEFGLKNLVPNKYNTEKLNNYYKWATLNVLYPAYKIAMEEKESSPEKIMDEKDYMEPIGVRHQKPEETIKPTRVIKSRETGRVSGKPQPSPDPKKPTEIEVLKDGGAKCQSCKEFFYGPDLHYVEEPISHEKKYYCKACKDHIIQIYKDQGYKNISHGTVNSLIKIAFDISHANPKYKMTAEEEKAALKYASNLFKRPPNHPKSGAEELATKLRLTPASQNVPTAKQFENSEEANWWNSVNSMLGYDGNEKHSDGLTKVPEAIEASAGQVGFAPQGRIGWFQ